MVNQIPISIIPRAKLNIDFVSKSINNQVGIGQTPFKKGSILTIGIEIPPVIELYYSKTLIIKIIKESPSVNDIELIVETDGQTQFNVFLNSSPNILIINGVEYSDYLIQNINGNLKLVWSNIFQLQTTDKLIFRNFNV